ncbi:MAG: 3D domain-containing protein [Verrucomicrobiaceae bacterium]|nr:3D domain-containing protein [Verrucomicrobiaceae bacterium]
MLRFLSPTLALCALMLTSCASTTPVASKTLKSTRIPAVRTTAYTHSESDHIVYGNDNALGGDLKYGNVRSAAADWSVYPVGTIFQIEGTPHVYQVDDYGSALVGTNTIDLYKPSRSEMNQWGVRKVNIRVLRWGSFSKSLAILKPRSKWNHVDKMVDRIERKKM